MKRDISAWLRTSKGSNKSMEALFQSFVHYMQEERGLDVDDFLREDLTVPVSVFAIGLSPSEALCAYLKEKKRLPFRRIGDLLNRDERSAWTSYRRAKSKRPDPLLISEEGLRIPVSIFTDRSMSILEHVVSYALEHTGMSVPNLARLLNKHPSALHTVIKRARQKQALNESKLLESSQ